MSSRRRHVSVWALNSKQRQSIQTLGKYTIKPPLKNTHSNSFKTTFQSEQFKSKSPWTKGNYQRHEYWISIFISFSVQYQDQYIHFNHYYLDTSCKVSKQQSSKALKQQSSKVNKSSCVEQLYERKHKYQLSAATKNIERDKVYNCTNISCEEEY